MIDDPTPSLAPDALATVLLRTLVEHARSLMRAELDAAFARHTHPGTFDGQGREPLDNAYLTTAQAAKIVDVAPATIRAWIRSGKLEAVRAGREYRVRRRDLEAAMPGACASQPEELPALTPERRARVTRIAADALGTSR